MSKAVRKQDDSFKGRWKDVVVWKAFWEELEEILLTRARESFLSGCKFGKKEGSRRERRALRVECREAFRAIATALKEPSGGPFWAARKILDRHDIYHDDLEGSRVLRRLAELMLTRLAACSKPAKGKAEKG